VSEAKGLSRFQPVVADGGVGTPRIPTQTSADLLTLRRVADEVRRVADDIEPAEPEGGEDDDFDQNLAEDMDATGLAKLASELLLGIDADLKSREQWEKITEKAIEYLGLIFEGATGQVSPQGSIATVWHTLMLESSIQFWANAQAEFLPAEGPVKIRDDKLPATRGGIGDNGGPSLDDSEDRPFASRDEKSEALETLFNHYLTVGDKQYYRDFSRMLFALGPIGTQFRKVYYNPLRRMPVSEWVKAENLIVSNDAVHLATAGRVTERIPVRHADLRRMQWLGLWLKHPIGIPVDRPTGIEEIIGQVEGIQPGPELPADFRHTVYECYCELNLANDEHLDEDGEPTGIPRPYRVSIDKDSRRILEIRRNWRKEDENFEARQRYVMFGMIPGFGFYYLGYVHVLGNTERALTAIEREMIDAGMFASFPGFLWKKGARPDTTQTRIPPGGAQEVNIGMADDIRKVVMPVPYKDISPQLMALAEKLESNGRKLGSILEMPVGEGMANVPVGTILSMIEEGTKIVAAVHKGLHFSRTEELQLLKELIAEDPSVLTRGNPTQRDRVIDQQEFDDANLVPSSDPNTPSHIHRVMRATAYAQLKQIFPEINSPLALERILRIIRDPDPMPMILPQQPGAGQPAPQAITAQARIQTAQIQAQSRQQSDLVDAQTNAADRASKERIAQMGEITERMKDATDAQTETAKLNADRQDAQLDRDHETGLERQRQAQPGIAPQRVF